jgi:hypothetical protein
MAGYVAVRWENRHQELSSGGNAVPAQPGHDHLAEPPDELQECCAMFLKWLKDSGSQTAFFDMMSAKSTHDDPARKLRDIRKIYPDLRMHISKEDEPAFNHDTIAMVVPFGARYQGYTPHTKLRC